MAEASQKSCVARPTGISVSSWWCVIPHKHHDRRAQYSPQNKDIEWGALRRRVRYVDQKRGWGNLSRSAVIAHLSLTDGIFLLLAILAVFFSPWFP